MSALHERIAAAANQFGVTAESITGPSRFREHVTARQHVMRELRMGGWSLSQIARAFNRHHTSVLHLTRGYEPPQPEHIVRPLPVEYRPSAPRPAARQAYVAGSDREAEIHDRNYMREYRRNCVEGSAALRDGCLALLARRLSSVGT